MAYGYIFHALDENFLKSQLSHGQMLPESERAARLAFYEAHGIGWVARPPEGEPSANSDGTKYARAGRFKKASNMNYALALSRKAERHLRDMAAAGETGPAASSRASISGEGSGLSESDQALPTSLEERALVRAVEETWEESGKRWKPWAKNGQACRIGEIVLLVDSDTLVPEVGLPKLLPLKSLLRSDVAFHRTACGMLPGRWRNVQPSRSFNTRLVGLCNRGFELNHAHHRMKM